MKSLGALMLKALQRGQLLQVRNSFETVSSIRSLSTAAPSVPYSEARNHDELINVLSERLINEPAVAHVMRFYDRQFFARSHSGIPLSICYRDDEVEVGYGQSVTSPSIHAVCLDTLYPYLTRHTGEAIRALDVGGGTGYMTACMSHLVDKRGHVVYVEVLEEIFARARWALAQTVLAPRTVTDPEMLRELSDSAEIDTNCIFNTTIVNANALEITDELKKVGPYDAIHVGAAAAEAPAALLDLLAPGGALLIPIGLPNTVQTLTVFERSADGASVSQRKVCGVHFTPLAPPFIGSLWRMP